MSDWITFYIYGAPGVEGTIAVPRPQVWYRRWALRLAAWLWIKASEPDPRIPRVPSSDA